MNYILIYLLLAIALAALSYASLPAKDASSTQSQYVCGILGLLWPVMAAILALSLLATLVALIGVAIAGKRHGGQSS